VKRALGFLLTMLGIVATAAGAAVVFTTVFGWNGRHAVATYDLAVGTPLRATFEAKRGVRYTAGVEVVFERSGLEERDGQLLVAAHMPLVARLRDEGGNKRAEVVGWLDPNEPPTVLFGHLADPRAQGRGPRPEVMAERLVGPFPCPRDERIGIEVDLGPPASEGPEASRIAKTRVVLYDDAYPAAVSLALGVAGAGLVASLSGMAVLMAGFFRKKRGIPARAMSSSLPKRLSSVVLAAMVAAAYAEPAFAQQTPPKSNDAKKKDGDKKAGDKGKKAADTKAEPKTEEPKQEKSAAETAEEAAQKEAQAEMSESHRAVYLGLDGGILRSDLGGLSDSLSLDRTGANGLSYSIGAGVRLDSLRFGAKFHGFATTEYEFWSVMAEAGWGMSLRPFQPVFFLHAGWMWNVAVERSAIASSLPAGNFLPPSLSITGPVVGVEAFGAYWVNHIVRVGPFIGADAMFLHRSQTSLPQSVLPGQLPDDILAKPLYNESGSGVGYSINLGLRGSLDLGF
jgi:hypothetical protein